MEAWGLGGLEAWRDLEGWRIRGISELGKGREISKIGKGRGESNLVAGTQQYFYLS